LEKDIYKVVPAPDELKRYVRCYMVANADDSGGLEMPVRPTGYCYFGWVLPNSDSCSTKFSAQHLEVKSRTTHLSGQVSDDDITIKYHGATGLYELFHVNAEKWTNICVDGGSVSPAMNKVQTDLFKGSESFAEEDLYSHIELFTAALIKQSAQAISAPSYVSKAVAEIELNDGVIRLGDLAEKLNISARQLNRKFTEVVGISPKYFAGILQVNRVVRAMLEDDSSYFADLAQAHGFYDQSHLIKTAQKFLGSTPLEFLQSEEDMLFTFLGKLR